MHEWKECVKINNILPTKDASRMKNRFLHKVPNEHKFQNKHKGELQGKGTSIYDVRQFATIFDLSSSLMSNFYLSNILVVILDPPSPPKIEHL